MPKLTVKKIEALKAPGMHGDGGGLYLRVGPTGSKSWILRTVVHGKRRELGVGSAALVSLAEARDAARELRKVARAGGDPETIRKRKEITFEQATREVHKNSLPTWRNPRHGEIWLRSFEIHVFPQIGSRPIDTLRSSDVLAVLAPIWTETHDTARRVKQRIAAVFDWAKSAGHYPSENPVNGLKKALPTVRQTADHMAALPWTELPAFMAKLREREGISARTLEFIILTASRSGEARLARWSEIQGNVWTVPAERMKRGVEHRVPLPEETLAVLEAVRGLDADLIFPSTNRGSMGETRGQSMNVFNALYKRMGVPGITTHGFRSTFRDWCGESARAEREVAEAALSHTIGNKVERAYARSDLFERRRALMEAWARFATGKAGDVVELVRA